MKFILPNLYLLLALLLTACDQNAPPSQIDLKAAAKVWNTDNTQWKETELYQLEKGRRLYRSFCAACHLSSGKGQLQTIGSPALAGSSVATGPAETLIATVLNGRRSMPSFRKSLGNAEIATILSYVRNAWGNNSGKLVKESEVNSVRPDQINTKNSGPGEMHGTIQKSWW